MKELGPAQISKSSVRFPNGLSSWGPLCYAHPRDAFVIHWQLKRIVSLKTPPQKRSQKTKPHSYEAGSGPYPEVSKNVDFKHSFDLVVLSREQISSCNHTGVVHQDGDIPNFLFHLLDRKNQKSACQSLPKPPKCKAERQSLSFLWAGEDHATFPEAVGTVQRYPKIGFSSDTSPLNDCQYFQSATHCPLPLLLWVVTAGSKDVQTL